MLTFNENYYENEDRLGFHISSTMKHAWAGQLEVLLQIINVCKTYSIEYYAFWGTLLGSIRHDGYIPWDDDIDIAMKREDYMRFIQVAKVALPPEYCVLNIYNEAAYANSFTRVTNSHSINTSPHHLETYHGCPFVIGIDIFPLDYIPSDNGLKQTQMTIFNMIKPLLSIANSLDKTRTDNHDMQCALNEGLAALRDIFGTEYSDRSTINELRLFFDKACMLSNSDDSDFITSMPEYSEGQQLIFNKNWFTPSLHRFENIDICIPTEYDKVLSVLFGDYMTPVISRDGHDYPFYKEQLQIMHNSGIWLDINE